MPPELTPTRTLAALLATLPAAAHVRYAAGAWHVEVGVYTYAAPTLGEALTAAAAHARAAGGAS